MNQEREDRRLPPPLSEGASKRVRELKAQIHQKADLTNIPIEQKWADMQELLRVRLPNYPKLEGSGYQIIFDWFQTRLSARNLPPKEQNRINAEFTARYKPDQLLPVRDALIVITGTLSK